MSRLHGLRLRIALLVAAVVLVCVGVAFVAIYGRTASQLSQRSEEDIRSDMEALEQIVRNGPTDPQALADRARAFLDQEPFRATTHIVFVATPGAAVVTNEPKLLPGARSAPVGRTVRVIPGAGPFTLLVRDVHRDGRVTRLGVGEPTAATDRAKDAVSTAFLLAGGLAALAALLGGAIVASRIAAPLRRMAGVASRVDAGDLGPRMGIHDRRDEVGVLAESFDHMLERLEAAFDRQSAFVADASHELRTPLTVIRGQLEVLALDDAPSADEIRRVERMVRTEIARMDRLVDDLLLLAQADSTGFLRTTTFPLRPFLEDLVEGLSGTADRQLELGAVPDGDAVADEDRLAQALRNLLRNAIEHTAVGGRIRLEAQRDARSLRFVVDDDGPGIPEQQRAAVFDRFHRIDPGRARADGGAGLGLAIVQAIAEAHGGRASADASPWGGARMVVEIPSRS